MMSKKTLIVAIATLCVTASTAVFAQNNDRRDDRNDRNRGEAQQRNDDKHNYQDRGRNDRNDYTVRNDDRGPRGAGPRHDMRKGGRLPSDYRSKQYVVNDWRGHHLNAPPRGTQWVQAGSDYVLVAIATGIIAQVLLNN